jgi:hypothetical protein
MFDGAFPMAGLLIDDDAMVGCTKVVCKLDVFKHSHVKNH